MCTSWTMQSKIKINHVANNLKVGESNIVIKQVKVKQSANKLKEANKSTQCTFRVQYKLGNAFCKIHKLQIVLIHCKHKGKIL